MGFSILENFSKLIEDNVKDIWHKKENLTTGSWSYRNRNGTMGHFDDYVLSKDHEIFDLVKNIVGVRPFTGAYMVSHPRTGHAEPHIDMRRGCGLNIPVEVDIDNNLFYIQPKKLCQTIINKNKLIEFKPEEFQFYDMRTPILMDSKSLHGFANWADTDRVMFTFSFSESYEEILEHLPKEWF